MVSFGSKKKKGRNETILLCDVVCSKDTDPAE